MDEPSRILVRRAQEDDDTAALDELFERYRDRVRRALRRMLDGRRLSHLDSEDAVQDAILAALASLRRFEYRGEGSFLAWLLKTARNQVLERLRASRTQKRDANRARSLDSLSEPGDHGPTPSQVAQGAEMEERLQVCLSAMPEREREIILLRRYLQSSTEEIQLELELPTAGATRALLSRAQTRLAQMLDTSAQ